MTFETGIVIVHFGDSDITCRCLRSIAAMKTPALVVIINNDDEACLPALKTTAKELTDISSFEVIQSPSNGGFAAGCNQGIKRASDAGVKYIWLLNNDTEPEANALLSLQSCASQRPNTILGATVVEHDNPDIIQVAAGVSYDPTTTRIVPAHSGESASQAPTLAHQKYDYIFGASMFIPAAAFVEVGYLDEVYFLYYEELDFCTRAIRKGVSLDWCRESVVRHLGGSATGGNTKNASWVSVYHEARSTILFTRKHHPSMLLPALFLRLLLKPFFLLLRKQSKHIPTALKGTLNGLFAPLP